MIEKTYDVIDFIKNTDIIKEIYIVKKEINDSKTCKKLIKQFKNSKELYEKYNDEKEFKKAKELLLKNKTISKYIKLQNKINMLTLYINSKIDDLIKEK